MTPPIRIPLPSVRDSLETRPASPFRITIPSPETLAVPRFTVSPLLPSMLPTFRLSPLFFATSPLSSVAAASSSSPAAPLRFVDFLPALYGLADGIESMDLDATNVPVNRNSGLCRYSEFTPRTERPADCSLTVYENTRAQVHGEIRPIHGTDESLITRFSVDFFPNVFNAAVINPLEVDGFSGVDAPDLTYDRSFASRSPVLGASGGNFNYENFFNLHGAVATPFGQEAAPPPHRDFMIRFAPVEPTVLSAVQGLVGANRLLLWAFLPTMGISDPSMFERLGIRFNTMPRRFSDLFRLFSPLFDPERGRELRQAAPYLNPNSEILLDAEELSAINTERAGRNEDPLVGLRQALPLDREELLRWDARRQALNARRVEQHLPPLPNVTTNRGPVIDWVFSDLIHDPARLSLISDSELPALTARARLRATTLTLPMGRVSLNAGAEIHVRYALERVANPAPGANSVQRVVEVRIEPVSLASVDLDAGGAHVSADHLDVNRLEFRMSMPIMNDPSATSPGSSMDVTLSGVQAQNLGLASPELHFSTHLNSAHLTSLSFHRSPTEGFTTEVNGLEAQGVHLAHSTFNLDLASLSVPTLHLQRGVESDGRPGPLRIRVPSLGIDGVEGSGRVPIHNGSFHLSNGDIELQRGRSVFEGDLDLRGSFPNGFSEGPIALDTLTVQAAVEDLQVQGRARIEMRTDGFSLRRSSDAAPLNIHFNVGQSWLEHHPALLPTYLRGLGASDIIHTRVDVAGARVQVDDLSEVEVVQTETPEGRRGQIRQLHCGPITLHHIVAGGRIWAGLPIWGYIRGLFSDLGGGTPAASARRPDFSPLLRHLPEEARALVGDSDFLRIGGVELRRESSGAWQTNLGDTVLALREAGGRHQFAGLRVHHLNFGTPAGAASGTPPTLLGPTPFWINIFLNDPDRGGSFRFFRWPERP